MTSPETPVKHCWKKLHRKKLRSGVSTDRHSPKKSLQDCSEASLMYFYVRNPTQQKFWQSNNGKASIYMIQQFTQTNLVVVSQIGFWLLPVGAVECRYLPQRDVRPTACLLHKIALVLYALTFEIRREHKKVAMCPPCYLVICALSTLSSYAMGYIPKLVLMTMLLLVPRTKSATGIPGADCDAIW